MPFQSTRARRLSILILAAAYIAALTPFTTYIGEVDFILNMVIVIGLASIAMTIAGAYAAFQALGRDKHKIAIPERLQHSQTLSQWWIAFRYTCRYQWWLVLPRLGLAYGLAHWFHANAPYGVFDGSLLTSLYRPYIYYSYQMAPSFVPVFPQIETFLISSVFMFVFAMTEATLQAALIALSWNRQQSRFIGIIKFSILRLSVIVVVCLLITSYYLICREDWNLPQCFGSPTPHLQCTNQDYQHYRWWITHRYRVWETLVTATNSNFGNGILHSANIMRPVGEGTSFAARDWVCNEERRNCTPTAWDNRPFVLRQVVAGLLGLLMYGGLTGGVLWLSSKRAHPPPQ